MVARHTVESGEAEESWNHTVRAAREMARAGVDIIVLGGGPVVYSQGSAQAAQSIKNLEEELGVPVTNSTTAYRQANVALGAKVVGHVSYASPPGAVDHLPSGEGRERGTVRSAGTKYASYPFIDVGRIPSEVPARLARELKQAHPEIDTIQLGSPHWATGVLVDPLEKELGVNIVAGSPAILWWALRSRGIEDRIQGYGRLLREH
jgi:maleate isomerase